MFQCIFSLNTLHVVDKQLSYIWVVSQENLCQTEGTCVPIGFALAWVKHGIKSLRKIVCLRKLKFLLKDFQFIFSHWIFVGAWQIIKNYETLVEHGRHYLHCSTNFLMTVYCLPFFFKQWRHRSVTTATTALSNVLPSPFAECRQYDIMVAIMIDIWRHLYRSMKTVYVMLHQFFSYIRKCLFFLT